MRGQCWAELAPEWAVAVLWSPTPHTETHWSPAPWSLTSLTQHSLTHCDHRYTELALAMTWALVQNLFQLLQWWWEIFLNISTAFISYLMTVCFWCDSLSQKYLIQNCLSFVVEKLFVAHNFSYETLSFSSKWRIWRATWVNCERPQQMGLPPLYFILCNEFSNEKQLWLIKWSESVCFHSLILNSTLTIMIRLEIKDTSSKNSWLYPDNSKHSLLRFTCLIIIISFLLLILC